MLLVPLYGPPISTIFVTDPSGLRYTTQWKMIMMVIFSPPSPYIVSSQVRHLQTRAAMDDRHGVYTSPEPARRATLMGDRIRRKRHFLVILALVLDGLVLALAWAVQQQDIFLDTNDRVEMLQKFLPAMGALIGFCVTSANVLAFTALITEYAKIKMVGDGLTLSELGYMHSLGKPVPVFAHRRQLYGRCLSPSRSQREIDLSRHSCLRPYLPSSRRRRSTPYRALSVVKLSPVVEFRTYDDLNLIQVCVSSMTPSDFSWSTSGNMPVVDFSASSGITPLIE